MFLYLQSIANTAKSYLIYAALRGSTMQRSSFTETAAGLWETGCLPLSGISCTQVRHWLSEGRKSRAQVSHVAHGSPASNSPSEEAQVRPGCLGKVQGQTEICSLREVRDF